MIMRALKKMREGHTSGHSHWLPAYVAMDCKVKSGGGRKGEEWTKEMRTKRKHGIKLSISKGQRVC